MYGAIIGDIVGSRFELNNIKTKDFKFFHSDCRFTDDTVMTLAIAQAVLDVKDKGIPMKRASIDRMLSLGRAYPHAGYGRRFKLRWLKHDHPKPYKSLGNGSAMRVSACGLAADTDKEAVDLAYASAIVSHNHDEGLKGAMAVAMMIFMAKHNRTKREMRGVFEDRFYPIEFKLADIRAEYEFDETCPGSVPQAMEAFLESTSFEDAIRNAISIGGDSDTIAAITGSIAEAFYGIPEGLKIEARKYLDAELLAILDEFEKRYPSREMRKAVSCGPILRSFAGQFLKSVDGEDKKTAAFDLSMLLGMLAGASVAVPFSIGDDDDYRHAIESKAGSSPENPLRLKPVTIESQGRRWILAYSDEEWMQKTETFKLPHRIMPFVECIGIAEKLQGRSNCEPIGIALDMYTESACALTPEMLSLCKQRQ